MVEVNPWMFHGIAQVKGWMEQFTSAYNAYRDPADRAAPAPSQIVFDEEGGIYGWSFNSMKAWQQFVDENEPRFEQLPVPGFGVPLAQLYADARLTHGFPADPTDAVDPTVPFNHPNNQRFNLWFSNVAVQIMQGAREEALYTPIRQAWGNDCIVSNYADIKADGARQLSSWHYPGYQYGGPGLTRTSYRVVQTGDASAPYYVDAPTNPAQPLGVWYTQTGDATSDLRAPVLYYVGTAFDAPNPYVSVQSTNPDVVRWESALRAHRHTFDAILNTPGETPEKLSPWVMLVDTRNKGSNTISPGDDEVRQQQMMLRSKRVGREFVWYDPGSRSYALIENGQPVEVPGSNPTSYVTDPLKVGAAWVDFRRVFWQVYAPRLEFESVVTGGNPGIAKEDALEDTLLFEGEPRLCRLACIDEAWETASIEVKAKNLNSMRASKLGVYVEVSAVSEQAGQAPGVTEGAISLWNRSSGQWENHTFTLPAHSEGTYVDQAARVMVESTHGIENYVAAADGGSALIRVGMLRQRQLNPSRPRFIGQFDLMQVVGIGEGPGLGTPPYALDRPKCFPASLCPGRPCVIGLNQPNAMALVMEDETGWTIQLRFDGPVTLGSAAQPLSLYHGDLNGFPTGADLAGAVEISVAGDNTIQIKAAQEAVTSGRLILRSREHGIVCQGVQNNGAAIDVAPFDYNFFLVANNGTGDDDDPCGPQDFNGDGDAGTDQDIEAFFACVGGNCCPTCYPGGSDFNGDGDFGTDADIESFFRVLGGGRC